MIDDGRVVVNVRCPYCAQAQSILVKPGRPEVVVCDTEDVPGCDRYFSVEAQLRISTVIYTMRQVVHSSSQEVVSAEA